MVQATYVTASRIISHDAALFKIVLALYIKVQALSFDMVLQWTLANPDPVSPNPRKSKVQAPSSRITFGMILGLKVTLCACAFNNYLRIRFQQLQLQWILG